MKIKLYHIDRAGHLKENDEIEPIKDIQIRQPHLLKECENLINNIYPEGLSFHGRRYFLDNINNFSMGLDIIFEYERRLHYPEKLSRYQSLFAFDKQGVYQFIQKKELNYEYYKIYEIEYEYCEKHDMNLIRGWGQYDCTVNAKYYWENIPDYNPKNKPLYEFLVKLPVKIGKEVPYEYFIPEEK